MSRLAASLVLLLLLPAAIAGEESVHTTRPVKKLLPPPKEQRAFSFLIFGDRTGGPREGLRILAKAVKDANLLDPDLVMTVGDLVPGYNRTKQWIAEMKEYTAIMDRLAMPWFQVAGNHDVYWTNPFRPDAGTPPGQHERDFEEHFGPLWYWFPHKNAAFVVLFSDEGDRATNRKGYAERALVQFSDEQLAFLTRTLTEARDYDHVFLFLHHPRWITDLYPDSNWEEVHKRCVAAGNVTAVFAGHIHRQRYDGRRDGIEYYTLATTGGGMPFDRPGTGFLHHMNLVTVRKDRISVSTLPVGAVLDPKEMTPAHLKDVDRARALPLTLVGEPLAVAADGSAEGFLRYAIENPATRPLEATVTIEAREGDWRFRPGHLHLTLEPGVRQEFRVWLARPADGFRGPFSVPALTVAVDYLSESRRISLPEVSRAASLHPEGLGAGPAGANRATALDGKGACWFVPSKSLSLPDGSFTVEAWFLAEKVNGERAIVGKTEASGYTVFLRNGAPAFFVHLGKRYLVAQGDIKSRVKPGGWHHIAGVFDGREARVYLDGRLVARAEGGGKRTPNAFPLYVGAEPSPTGGPSFPFAGAIDEVRISKSARYEGKTFDPKRRFEPDADTALLLHLDRARGPFTPDASGRKSHAIAAGKPRFVPVE